VVKPQPARHPVEDTTHECPAPRCKARVVRDMFACRSHWFLLPADLRGRIWRAWRSGDFSEHAAALSDARKVYQEKLGRDTR
jgi:hypothetical protein